MFISIRASTFSFNMYNEIKKKKRNSKTIQKEKEQNEKKMNKRIAYNNFNSLFCCSCWKITSLTEFKIIICGPHM